MDVLNDLMYAWFTHKWIPEHSECELNYEGNSSQPSLMS